MLDPPIIVTIPSVSMTVTIPMLSGVLGGQWHIGCTAVVWWPVSTHIVVVCCTFLSPTWLLCQPLFPPHMLTYLFPPLDLSAMAQGLEGLVLQLIFVGFVAAAALVGLHILAMTWKVSAQCLISEISQLGRVKCDTIFCIDVLYTVSYFPIINKRQPAFLANIIHVSRGVFHEWYSPGTHNFWVIHPPLALPLSLEIGPSYPIEQKSYNNTKEYSCF